MRKEIFHINSAKAANKLTINSLMMGSLFFILTMIWIMPPHRFTFPQIAQMVLAVPLYFVSTLAFSKIAYQQETRLWDVFGWATSNLANIFFLNAIGLMVAVSYHSLAVIYFALIMALMLVYSAINISYNYSSSTEKIFKFAFLIAGVFFGGLWLIL